MNLIIGDSHILALRKYNSNQNNLFQCSASSIRGLLNKNSKTGTGNQIINLANSLKYDKLFIFKLTLLSGNRNNKTNSFTSG